MSQPQSLPAFLKQHSEKGLLFYGVLCPAARTKGIPGIVKSPTGYGWTISDEIKAFQSLCANRNKVE
jgi:hypothetical protein